LACEEVTVAHSSVNLKEILLKIIQKFGVRIEQVICERVACPFLISSFYHFMKILQVRKSQFVLI